MRGYYDKLRHLLNGNFDLLHQVIAEEGADCDIQDGFPLRELGKRENFLSLLHCFGLHPWHGRGPAAPRHPQPDREAADVRHPAQRRRSVEVD